ncbi:transposase [Salmonella enterica]|uniref:Transposase n=1 Tax=Salmonella enterica TaxID=28901 RepID=A0A5U2FA06_SALER|nr:transposase [Salmonella enterica]
MTKNTRFSPEVRQRAIRMVIESQNDYGSQWAAISSIAPKIGCTPETLRTWLRYVIEHIQEWPANRVRNLLPWKVELTAQ